MIIVRLKGGRGNQMFQYALGRALSLKNDTILKLDTTYLENKTKRKNFTFRNFDLSIFNIKAEIAKTSDLPFFYRFLNGRFVFIFEALVNKFKLGGGLEKKFSFNENILNLKDGAYVSGYWQSPKYFSEIESTIRNDFSLKELPLQNIQDKAHEIKNTDSVCIHVRRGDYVGNPFYDVTDLDFYKKGIDLIRSQKNISKIYVFSDDIDWCKENLKFDIETFFVDDSFNGDKNEGTMYLMSFCKNFVISNSTFAWWGAWLAPSSDKIVVCPKRWFGDDIIDTSDLIPKEWIRI